MIPRVDILTFIAVTFFALPGCQPVTLHMQAERELRDRSVSKPLTGARYNRLIVLPPTGTARGAFDSQIALFEAEFLRRGIEVISGAITGRAVGKDWLADHDLSDVERALVMAAETGADGVLQIGAFSWSWSEPSRFCVYDPVGPARQYYEVEAEEYQRWDLDRYAFMAPGLQFVGKLIDVSSGEVIIAFDIEDFSNFHLPRDFSAEVAASDADQRVRSPQDPQAGSSERDEVGRGQSSLYVSNETKEALLAEFEAVYALRNPSFTYTDASWLPVAERACRERIIARIADMITGQSSVQ